MEHGGAWMGFHFAGFALTPSDYPAGLGLVPRRVSGRGPVREQHLASDVGGAASRSAGSPVSSRPTDDVRSAPSEWYRWENDLRTEPGYPHSALDRLDQLSARAPVPSRTRSGTAATTRSCGPTRSYRMIYLNMGHNDMDYEHKTNRQLSSTFSEAAQNELITRALLWLGDRSR